MTLLEKLWSGISPKGNCQLLDAKGRLIVGWITEERAKEYQAYYAGSKIVRVKN